MKMIKSLQKNSLKKQYSITEKVRLSKRKRQRQIGAGHPFDLSIEDKLVMLLVYYKLYITCELAGYLFDLDQVKLFLVQIALFPPRKG